VAPPRPTKETILVVDDDDTSLKVTAARLENAGYSVITQRGSLGTGAVVARVQPDYVLLDVLMPALDGTRLAQMLATLNTEKQIHSAGIILYSGMDDTTIAQAAQDAGALGYISKVLSRQDFLDALRRIIDRHRASLGR
jgi:CheY-like chemotaxis protein